MQKTQGKAAISTFDDSEPIALRSMDLEGNSHNFKEAVQQIYKNLNLPVNFVSAGWNSSDKYAQANAEELVDFVKKNPQAMGEFSISINPFNPLIISSISNAKAGKPEVARLQRELFTSDLANTLYTFLPVFKNDSPVKGTLIYRHALPENEGVAEKDLAKLYQEIYAKLEQRVGYKLDGYDLLNPETVTKFDSNHLIQPKGRGKKYFSDYQKFIKAVNEQQNINKWNKLNPQEKKEHAYLYTMKGIDLNGQVYCVNSDEILINTDIQLNYLNKAKPTPVLYSDAKYNPLIF